MSKTLSLLEKSGAFDKNPQRKPTINKPKDAQGNKLLVPKTPPKHFRLSVDERKCWRDLIKTFGELPASYTTQIQLAAKLQNKIAGAGDKFATTDINQLNSIMKELNKVANFAGDEDESFD